MIATLLSTPLLLAALADPVPPPGMVYVEGGRTKIGLDTDAARELILENGKTSIWGETPEHEVRLDDFFLMVTEVTNEQFAEFVVATGSKPPEHWGKAAIDAAQHTYLEEQGKRIADARAAGETPPDRIPFVRDVWWNLNWKDAEWEIPKGTEAKPVTFVDHAQAEAYARWAGLRLMTEAEFQRAVRGGERDPYTWGEEWEAGHAVTNEAGAKDIQPVGSMPAGASKEGVLDLLGNVWEWTDTAYTGYEKYKPDTLKVKDRGNTRYIDLLCDWDPNMRVTVGGSFANDKVAARATTRRPTERFQTTNALGFRCAADVRIGADMARVAYDVDLARHVRSENDFDFSLTIATDRWKSRRGIAPDRYKNAENSPNPLEAYAVITDYDFFLFTPVSEIKASNVNQLAKDTVEEGPAVLGFFSTTLPVAEPALEPGTYLIAWRGAGQSRKRRDKDEEEDEEAEAPPTLEEQIGLDTKVENFVIFDRDGKPLVAVPSGGLSFDRLREGTLKTTSVAADERKGITAHELVTISGGVAAGRRGFLFDLPLKLTPGAMGGDWRR